MRTFYDSLPTSVSLGMRLIILLEILFCLIGSTGMILSIIELFHGRPKVFHYDENQGGLKIENPLWPSAGKGFWVGLVLLATGLVGILASRERTSPSFVALTTLSGVSTILSFYLLITCIIPLQYDTKYSDTSRPSWQSKELILNALLIAVGGLGIIIGVISALLGSMFAGCWSDQRKLNSHLYSDDPTRLLETNIGDPWV